MGDLPVPFADLLRRYRQAAGLTQEELAERAHLSVRGITDLERGARRTPRKDTVRLLTEALALGMPERAAFAAAARRQAPAATAPIQGAAGQGGARPAAPARGNLPLPLTSFVGRAREQAIVEQQLATARLVTLTGAGGCGKTRLALQVAAALQPAYPDGVWLVELAALGDAALVPQAVASVLGVREQPTQSLVAGLLEFLRHRRLLLLLDNCEHLVGACAALAEALSRVCPRLTILATSREALGSGGELTWRVPSLALPDARAGPALARAGEAVQLFAQRARAARPEFALTAENTGLVIQVCRLLDGMPLAIELAAARLAALSLEELAVRLDDRFRLLTGGSRTALPRQQTLRATLDWSHDLLHAAERVLLRRLTVFAGGWTLAAAEAVCGDQETCAVSAANVPPDAVLDLLAGLVNKSLVTRDEGGATSRYRLLETVRQYGHEQLVAAGEVERRWDRHLDWCLALAEEAEPALYGPGQGKWLDRLEAEHDNLRAALGRRLAAEGAARKQLLLATVLDVFWRIHGYMGEGRRWQEEAVAQPATRGVPALRARALAQAGFLASRQGDFAGAGALLEESESLARAIDDQSALARTLGNLAVVATLRGDYPPASAWLAESVALYRTLGDTTGIATTLGNLGNVAMLRGDYDRAWTLHEESLALRRVQGSIFSIAFELAQMGWVAYQRGDLERMVAVQVESLLLSRDIDARIPVSISLEGLAWVAGARGQAARAARLGAAAEVVREALGVPVQAEERAGHEQMVGAMRAALGAEGFAAAWAEGRALPLEEAITLALEAGQGA